MAPPLSWRTKVAALLKARGTSARSLAAKMGEKERTVRSWVRGTRRPLNETAVVAKLAAALHVTPSWLLSGRDEPPPTPVAARTIPDELLALVPQRFRRLLYAVADPETAEWLLAQLELYERARATRARAQ